MNISYDFSCLRKMGNNTFHKSTTSIPFDNTSRTLTCNNNVVEESTPAEKSLIQKIIRKGLVESKNDVEVQRNDPNSPLYSIKSFAELNVSANLMKGIYDMGYNKPSKIQETTLPALLKDPPMNLIAQSQSGTGKTAAFVLAMLSRVDATKNYPQVLCLSPTYELAIQTGEVACRMAKFTPEIKFILAVRGEMFEREKKIQEHIVIGTPGKMLDWALKFKHFDLKKIQVFVLDEADVMISEQGHYDQVHRIRKCLSSTCQILFFSATYDHEVMEFAESIVPDAMILRLKREDESLENIKQYYVYCKTEEKKYEAIANIYGAIMIGQAIIFCQTRQQASWLVHKMASDGHAVALLSAELTVNQRIAVLDRFREGKEKVLIATNVLSRGIDVEQVTLVVNFSLPLNVFRKPDCETYLHRIGRTGRFGKPGIAINLAQNEFDLSTLKFIENHFGKKIIPLDTENYEEMENLQN